MDSQRLTGSVLVVQVKTLLNLYNEKIVLENSGIKINKSYIDISNGNQIPQVSNFSRYSM